jgi:hypothetical protein
MTTVDKLVCPECKKVLRPAKPLPVGKKVRCPQCGTTFAAQAPATSSPLGPKGKPPKKPAAVTKGAAGKAPAKKKPHDDEDEEGGGIYSFADEDPVAREEEEKPEIEYAPDTSMKDLRGPAQEKVMKPSNMLLLASVIGVIGWIIFTIIVLVPLAFPLAEDEKDKDKDKAGTQSNASAPSGGQAGGQAGGEAGAKAPAKKKKSAFFTVLGVDISELREQEWYWIVLTFVGLAVCAIYAGVVATGAVKMQNLESRTWGMVSSFLAMVPLMLGGVMLIFGLLVGFLLSILGEDPASSEGFVYAVFALIWLAGAGVGAWTLMTCLNEDVKAGFEYVAE